MQNNNSNREGKTIKETYEELDKESYRQKLKERDRSFKQFREENIKQRQKDKKKYKYDPNLHKARVRVSHAKKKGINFIHDELTTSLLTAKMCRIELKRFENEDV